MTLSKNGRCLPICINDGDYPTNINNLTGTKQIDIGIDIDILSSIHPIDIFSSRHYIK